MKRTMTIAIAAVMMMSVADLIAGDRSQSRKRSKDGSGENCTLNSSISGNWDDCINKQQRSRSGGGGSGNGDRQQQRSRDGSCTAE